MRKTSGFRSRRSPKQKRLQEAQGRPGEAAKLMSQPCKHLADSADFGAFLDHASGRKLQEVMKHLGSKARESDLPEENGRC